VRKLILVLATLLASASAAAATPVNAVLDSVQYGAFRYFWYQANPANGLIRDRSQAGSPASIAAVGFGLSAICTGIDHGWITRAAGQARVLTTLNTFWNGEQSADGGDGGAMGYQGFFYHFLDMNTGLRTWTSELSTIDTGLLLAGVLDCRQYFNTADPTDVQIRNLADQINGRVNWTFMQHASPVAINHGWKPDDDGPGPGTAGYIDGGAYWTGYNEMMIMYILAMGSPTHAIPGGAWFTWINTYNWSNPGYGGGEYLVFPPLFGHQYSHCWIDFRNKRDAYMQVKASDYFLNSRRATLAQQAYCIANPGLKTGRPDPAGYSATVWGLTAGDGPNFTYAAHGAPNGFDDGTIQPTAAVASLPFAPEICLPTIQHLYDTFPALWGPFGFRDGFNLATNPDWYDSDYLGIDQGPIVMMIENYKTGAVWNRFMQNTTVQAGMAAAGFANTTGVDPPLSAHDHPALWTSPNPFTISTSIRFRLAAAGPVRLTVHDVRGREVARLLEGWTDAGEHTATFRGDGLKAGVYWYRLSAGDTEILSKGILIR
jgi:hypothetical protein